MDVTAQNTDKTVSDLDAHGLGEPLDDGEEGVGGEHGRLVRLRVDELAHVAVNGPVSSVQPVVPVVRELAHPSSCLTACKRHSWTVQVPQPFYFFIYWLIDGSFQT